MSNSNWFEERFGRTVAEIQAGAGGIRDQIFNAVILESWCQRRGVEPSPQRSALGWSLEEQATEQRSAPNQPDQSHDFDR